MYENIQFHTMIWEMINMLTEWSGHSFLNGMANYVNFRVFRNDNQINAESIESLNSVGF